MGEHPRRRRREHSELRDLPHERVVARRHTCHQSRVRQRQRHPGAVGARGGHRGARRPLRRPACQVLLRQPVGRTGTGQDRPLVPRSAMAGLPTLGRTGGHARAAAGDGDRRRRRQDRRAVRPARRHRRRERHERDPAAAGASSTTTTAPAITSTTSPATTTTRPTATTQPAGGNSDTAIKLVRDALQRCIDKVNTDEGGSPQPGAADTLGYSATPLGGGAFDVLVTAANNAAGSWHVARRHENGGPRPAGSDRERGRRSVSGARIKNPTCVSCRGYSPSVDAGSSGGRGARVTCASAVSNR